ncbi:MAG: DUF6077 domain-containing protein [Lachnospiraceae bacterium]|nr:DUF6077 domain-containing protein [Lachnospiraceae bacterium]
MIVLVIMLFVLANLLGGLYLFPMNDNRMGKKHLLSVFGYALIFSIFSLVIQIGIIFQLRFTITILISATIIIIGALLSAFVFRRKWLEILSEYQLKKDMIFPMIVLLGMILLSFFYTKNDFSNSSQLIAMTECYQKNTMTTMNATFYFFFAGLAKLISVHPLIIAKSFSGILLLPIFFLCYDSLGNSIFHNESAKKWFTTIAVIFLAIGNSCDVIFSCDSEKVFLVGFLYPFLFLLLFEDEKFNIDQKLINIFILVALGNLVGKQELVLLIVTIVIVYAARLIKQPLQKIYLIIEKNKMKKDLSQKEDCEVEDFMNSKKGKILWIGNLCLIPIIIVLLFSIYKLNTKINSVFTITQEQKEEITKLNQFSISRFTEADGMSFITCDTGSNQTYKLYQLNMNEDAGGLGYVLQLPSGGLVIIDGGYYGDGPAVREFIKSQGGKVQAWILTHPHYDHIGAFLNCMTEESEGITVQNVYYSPFTRDFFENSSNLQNDVNEEANKFDDFENVKEQMKDTTFIPMNKGDQLNLEGMNINCLWSFDPTIDDINDNSLVFRIEMNGVSLLITGDITEKIVDKLIQDGKNDEDYLDVDFIQIPHHGYTGTGTKLYQVTSPQFALLDCSSKEYTENILNIQEETVNNLHTNGIGIVKRFEGTNVIVIR